MEESADTLFDLVIVGGGISGLGAAFAAVPYGYKTAVVEKGSVSGATSNNSQRIIHGGLRYLQHMDIPRVIESLHDQAALVRDFPQHIEPLTCLMPVEQSGMRSQWPLQAAAVCYEVLARAVNRKSSGARIVRAADFPEVQSITGGASRLFLWHDALVKEPLAFAAHLRERLTRQGVRFFEHAEVRRVCRTAGEYQLEVHQNAGPAVLRSRAVVNAAGPWLHRLPKEFPSPAPQNPFGWCKGFDVILNACLEPRYAVGVFGGQKRSYFLTPRGNATVLGTEYLAYSASPDEVRVTEEEIAVFLASYNQTCSRVKLSLHDVAGVEVGVLPMKKLRSIGPKLYGLEKVSAAGTYVEVMSTKYTTFMSQGRKVVQMLASRL